MLAINSVWLLLGRERDNVLDLLAQRINWFRSAFIVQCKNSLPEEYGISWNLTPALKGEYRQSRNSMEDQVVIVRRAAVLLSAVSESTETGFGSMRVLVLLRKACCEGTQHQNAVLHHLASL